MPSDGIWQMTTLQTLSHLVFSVATESSNICTVTTEFNSGLQTIGDVIFCETFVCICGWPASSCHFTMAELNTRRHNPQIWCTCKLILSSNYPRLEPAINRSSKLRNCGLLHEIPRFRSGLVSRFSSSHPDAVWSCTTYGKRRRSGEFKRTPVSRVARVNDMTTCAVTGMCHLWITPSGPVVLGCANKQTVIC